MFALYEQALPCDGTNIQKYFLIDDVVSKNTDCILELLMTSFAKSVPVASNYLSVEKDYEKDVFILISLLTFGKTSHIGLNVSLRDLVWESMLN